MFAERKWLDNLLSEGDGGGREALAVAAALSDRSNHPVSKAVTALRKQVGGKLPKVDVVDFKLVPGTPCGKSPQICGILRFVDRKSVV